MQSGASRATVLGVVSRGTIASARSDRAGVYTNVPALMGWVNTYIQGERERLIMHLYMAITIVVMMADLYYCKSAWPAIFRRATGKQRTR